jgi:hypothetical protein
VDRVERRQGEILEVQFKYSCSRDFKRIFIVSECLSWNTISPIIARRNFLKIQCTHHFRVGQPRNFYMLDPGAWSEPVEFIPYSHILSLESILILSSDIRPVLPRGLFFFSRFPTKILYAFHICLTYDTWYAHLTLRGSVTLTFTVLGGE